MNTSPIDSKIAGLQNEKIILNLLRAHKELSQTQLCKLAHLGSSTASYIVGRLREKNLILERQGQSDKRGPKPVILSINPQGRFIASASINPNNIMMCLFDFNCESIECIKISLDSNNSAENVTDLLQINLLGLLSKYNINQENLVGFGVTLSGTIGPEGYVKLSSPLGWKDVSLKEMLSSKLNCPVFIFTTRVRFLEEVGINPELSKKTVLYLNIANGVGGTLFTEGRLAKGSTGRFGELGHVIVQPDGPLCGCGHKGCLEALVSGPALSGKIKRDIENGVETILSHMIKDDDMTEDIINKWGQALNKNDAYAIKLAEYIAEHVSRIATIAINSYDPQVVILAGNVANQCIDYITKSITRKISTDVYDNQSRQFEIIQAQAGKDALVKGSAIAVLQDTAEII